MDSKINVFWFRRDLRIEDNHGLFRALTSGLSVLPIFIFDTNILEQLDSLTDKRVSFIYQQLLSLHQEFEKLDSGLCIFHNKPIEAFQKLIETHQINKVFTNHDYEPYALQRDKEIEGFLNSKGVHFQSWKDQVIFEKSEILKSDGLPYTIYTPFSNRWKALLKPEDTKPYKSEHHLNHLVKINLRFPSLKEIGFELVDVGISLKPVFHMDTIKSYDETRNFPSLINGTTHLSTHLRFGTISIRALVNIALNQNQQWLNELIWREFFMQILFHFPRVVRESFKKQYDSIQWRNHEDEFQAWCEGKTGYPLVDAGMRELNQTGLMHNRVRMVVASFLTKHLLIDWRWGEAYFAKYLLDFDLSANNGNWQWAAGTGCDAAPYFRVFNPAEQAKKFDAQSIYIQKWLAPNDLLRTPIIEHSFARNRALEAYKVGLGKG